MKLVFSVFIGLTLWQAAQAACGADLTSSVSANLDLSIKNLWINSIHPYVVEMGDSFKANFKGTDTGNVTLVTTGSNATLMITSEGYVFPGPPVGTTPSTPTTKPVVSRSNTISVSLFVQGLLTLAGLLTLRWSTRGAYLTILLVICLSFFNPIDSAVDPVCDDAVVTLQIPSGKVNFICDVNNGTCVCGPDFSGPNCNYYKRTCLPNAEQMARRFNFDQVVTPQEIPLPEPGESFCDENFGTEAWRITNRSPFPEDQVAWTGDGAWDNRVHIFGYSGFSPTNKYFATQTASQPVFYKIDIDEMQIPHINTTHRIFARCYYQGELVPFVLGPAVWMTPTKIAYLYGYRVFALDIEKPDGNNYQVELIGDISSFVENNYYTQALGTERCSSSRRAEDGSVLMLCELGYSGTLPQPNPAHEDSHPNATCIEAQWSADGVSGRVGYVLIKVKSIEPADPATNIELVARFLNGLDSDHWYCFQSTLQWSTALNGYRRWTMYNGLNNGYKLALDRSGTWFVSQTTNERSPVQWSVGSQPFLKVEVRPLSEGGGFTRSIVTDWEGHGPQGWENTIQQSGATGNCSAWCIAYWDFPKVLDDDPGVYYPTSAIGPGFHATDIRYKIGLYGTFFHATATNRKEAIMQTSCKGDEIDCSVIPRASEVMRVVPDDSGGGTVERLISSRDYTYTQYATISSECDDTGPCWAAFQSTWGAPRSGGWTYSDVFIFRFR